MKQYNFFRSGTSHRLRIALNLKGLQTQYVPVDLRVEAHLIAAYKAVNPQMLVPALEVDGKVLIQSPAIIEWLAETHPTPALLPTDANDRAHVRALAALVGCDIRPLNKVPAASRLMSAAGRASTRSTVPVPSWTRSNRRRPPRSQTPSEIRPIGSGRHPWRHAPCAVIFATVATHLRQASIWF